MLLFLILNIVGLTKNTIFAIVFAVNGADFTALLISYIVETIKKLNLFGIFIWAESLFNGSRHCFFE
jgi:hypothetical protein